MSLSSHRPGRRALRAGALALAIASFAAMSQALPARADDERDAAANAAAEAEGVDAVRIGTTGGDMLAISGVDLLAAEGEGCGWIASIDELRELSETGRQYF